MKHVEKTYICVNDHVLGYSVFTHTTCRFGKVSEVRRIKSGELLFAINNERNMLEMVVTDPVLVFRGLK